MELTEENGPEVETIVTVEQQEYEEIVIADPIVEEPPSELVSQDEDQDSNKRATIEILEPGSGYDEYESVDEGAYVVVNEAGSDADADADAIVDESIDEATPGSAPDSGIWELLPILIETTNNGSALMFPYGQAEWSANLDAVMAAPDHDMSMEEVFEVIRASLNTPENEELVFTFEDLPLSTSSEPMTLGEDNFYAKEVTLGDLVKLIYGLRKNTPKERRPESLNISVATVERFTCAFNALSNALRAGKPLPPVKEEYKVYEIDEVEEEADDESKSNQDMEEALNDDDVKHASDNGESGSAEQVDDGDQQHVEDMASYEEEQDDIPANEEDEDQFYSINGQDEEEETGANSKTHQVLPESYPISPELDKDLVKIQSALEDDAEQEFVENENEPVISHAGQGAPSNHEVVHDEEISEIQQVIEDAQPEAIMQEVEGVDPAADTHANNVNKPPVLQEDLLSDSEDESHVVAANSQEDKSSMQYTASQENSDREVPEMPDTTLDTDKEGYIDNDNDGEGDLLKFDASFEKDCDAKRPLEEPSESPSKRTKP